MSDPEKISGPVITRLSPFSLRVYAALMTIPRGRVATYGAVAKAVGCRSARAIGNALRKNPFAPRVPCHRVIAADGRVGGYQGCRTGKPVTAKIDTLASEGVHFCKGRLIDRNLFYEPRPIPPPPQAGHRA